MLAIKAIQLQYNRSFFIVSYLLRAFLVVGDLDLPLFVVPIKRTEVRPLSLVPQHGTCCLFSETAAFRRQLKTCSLHLAFEQYHKGSVFIVLYLTCRLYWNTAQRFSIPTKLLTIGTALVQFGDSLFNFSMLPVGLNNLQEN